VRSGSKGKNIAAISSQEMDEIRKKIGMSFQGGAIVWLDDRR